MLFETGGHHWILSSEFGQKYRVVRVVQEKRPHPLFQFTHSNGLTIYLGLYRGFLVPVPKGDVEGGYVGGRGVLYLVFAICKILCKMLQISVFLLNF